MAPLLPTAFGRMPLEDATVVISSTSAFAHHVRPPDDAVHVAYCHAPPHFLWDAADYFHGRAMAGRALAPGARGPASLGPCGRPAGRRVRGELAPTPPNGSATAYDLDATVVYPPVDTAAFAPVTERSGRFLVVARLRRHKRIDLAVEAATRHGWPLDVIGEGPDEAALRRAAGPSVRFLGPRCRTRRSRARWPGASL